MQIRVQYPMSMNSRLRSMASIRLEDSLGLSVPCSVHTQTCPLDSKMPFPPVLPPPVKFHSGELYIGHSTAVSLRPYFQI